MTEMMISASDSYFAALQKIDLDAYITCFSKDAEVHDPYGSRPFVERSGLEKWFQGLDRTWEVSILNRCSLLPVVIELLNSGRLKPLRNLANRPPSRVSICLQLTKMA